MSEYREFEYAPQDNIEKYDAFAEKFMWNIFRIEEFLITDESSLYDFDFEFPKEGDTVIHRTEEYLKKIEYLYGIDVSDVEGLTLWKIFEKILKEKGANSGN